MRITGKWLVTLVVIILMGNAREYCKRNESCWPTQESIDELRKQLQPELKRQLYWEKDTPRICAVPYQSEDEQPLYGLGKKKLDALYVSSKEDQKGVCYEDGFVTLFCLASTRNAPYENWTPGFVVWALTVEHVQYAVQFARSHNLCIMVAGTGHDFMNRHSCQDGVFIRTTLMKNIEIDLNDTRQFKNSAGNVKFGPGIVFSEAHKAAADVDRVISSGWAKTVGIVGWSIGGGHGPFAPGLGLGADNILELEIVLANGTLVAANQQHHSDLYWALRGGGGSTWGVIVSITVKLHYLPQTGITFVKKLWKGDYCSTGKQDFENFFDNYIEWSLTLNSRWGGLLYLIPKYEPNNTRNDSTGADNCDYKWIAFMQYVYQGNDTEYRLKIDELGNKNRQNLIYNETVVVKNWYEVVRDYPLEVIYPFQNTLAPQQHYAGGLPSVLVNRSVYAGPEFKKYLFERMNDCYLFNFCDDTQQIFQDITGNIDSPQQTGVSISPGFRTAIVHLLSMKNQQTDENELYSLGKNSYFSESAYSGVDDFYDRYWGSNAQKLIDIKLKYDPTKQFYCRHCVGDELIEQPFS